MTQHQFAGGVAEWLASLPDEDARDTAELYLAACADEAGGDLHLTLETAKEMYEEATGSPVALRKALDDEGREDLSDWDGTPADATDPPKKTPRRVGIGDRVVSEDGKQRGAVRDRIGGTIYHGDLIVTEDGSPLHTPRRLRHESDKAPCY